MALQITYWTASRTNPNVPGAVISNEDIVLSGVSGQSAVTPANAVFVSMNATEDARWLYNSANPTALITSAPIKTGERIWQDAVAGYKIAGIQGA